MLCLQSRFHVQFTFQRKLQYKRRTRASERLWTVSYANHKSSEIYTDFYSFKVLNIRKPKLLCFQEDQKETLGRKTLNCIKSTSDRLTVETQCKTKRDSVSFQKLNQKRNQNSVKYLGWSVLRKQFTGKSCYFRKTLHSFCLTGF